MDSVSVTNPTSTTATEEGPLVAVSFQKDPERIRKYLESEPKALGITEVVLAVFQINTSIVTIKTGLGYQDLEIFLMVCSVLVIIGGIMAIAAKNLHLPTVKACLAAQVLACLASIISVFVSTGKLPVKYFSDFCWDAVQSRNKTEHSAECEMMSLAVQHYHVIEFLVHVALVSITATLASYCGKVLECCSPKSTMPVIRVSSAQPQQ